MPGEALPAIVPIKTRRVWRDLARSLSTIFNPFLTALALFIILAHIGAKDTPDFWRLLSGQLSEAELIGVADSEEELPHEPGAATAGAK